MNVVITLEPLARKSILIKDVTNDASIEEFIKKIRDEFNLQNLIISLYFPTAFTIRAYIGSDTYYKCENNNPSIYLLCIEGNKSVGMTIINSFEEISFNINMKVIAIFDITLRNVKGSETVAYLIEIIKKETNNDNYDNKIKIEEEHMIIDIL